MKKKNVTSLYTDSCNTYLLCEKGIMIYDKEIKKLYTVLDIKHPLIVQSDLKNGFLIILSTLNSLFIYSINDFRLYMNIELGVKDSSSNFIYDETKLCIFASNTNLDTKQFTLFKIDLKTKEITSKAFNRFSLAILCSIQQDKLLMIEEEIDDEPKEVSLVTLNVSDFSLNKVEKTAYKIGPLQRISRKYCYDFFGLFDFIEKKYYSFNELGVHIRAAQKVKYYKEQFYIFAGRDTYILSKELKVVEHLYNEDIEEWILDMLIEDTNRIIIKTNGLQKIMN